MTRSIARRALLISVVGALALGACGDDDNAADSTPVATEAAGGASTDTPAETAAPTDDTPYVEEDDGYGTPSTDAATTDAATTDVPGDTVAETAPPAQGSAAMTISGSAFSAATATAGEPFTIANDDDFGHTVTDRDGAFDVQLSGGSSETLVIDRAGDYEVFCRIHDFMSGTITVV